MSHNHNLPRLMLSDFCRERCAFVHTMCTVVINCVFMIIVDRWNYKNVWKINVPWIFQTNHETSSILLGFMLSNHPHGSVSFIPHNMQSAKMITLFFNSVFYDDIQIYFEMHWLEIVLFFWIYWIKLDISFHHEIMFMWRKRIYHYSMTFRNSQTFTPWTTAI